MPDSPEPVNIFERRLRSKKSAPMAARPAKRLKRAFSTSEVMNDEQKRKTPPKKTVTFGRKANMASQTEFDDVSTLIETNNRLTKQLIEQFKLIAGKDQRYINVLQMHTERMRNQELKEILKQKENDIAESERIIQEFKDKNFCQDLIQLDGTVPTIDVESPSKGASDGVADDAAGAAANEALDLLQ